MKKIDKYKKIVDVINAQDINDPIIILEVPLSQLPSSLATYSLSQATSSSSTFTVFPYSTRVH